ncbi:MAG TPA: hypothetical protein VKV28_01235 [Candidatus Binataceae bacterium]|nr:hypothetical protein [Candidatus Binataceae bacterium]
MKIGAVDTKVESLRVEMQAGTRSFDERLDGLRREMRAGFGSVDDRIETLKERASETTRRIDQTLDIRERLAALEAAVRLGQQS